MKESLSEAIKKSSDGTQKRHVNPDALIFQRIRIDESAIPVVLNPTGPNAYASGQDRRRLRREKQRRKK